MRGRELFDHALMLAGPSERQDPKGPGSTAESNRQGVNCFVFMITKPKH